MKFNLNDNSLTSGGSKVFNNGIAGLTKNVSVSVSRKTAEEQDTAPDYKVLITDDSGAQINQGFYYPTTNPQLTDDENQKKAGYLIGRILSVSNAVVPEGYEYPDVNGKSPKEIVDLLFKTIKENADGQKVNVFTTYGRKTQPSQYMGLRFFDFIERATDNSRLRAKGDDMLERLVEDAPANSGESKTSGTGDIW